MLPSSNETLHVALFIIVIIIIDCSIMFHHHHGGVHAKPSLSFSLPAIAHKFRGFGGGGGGRDTRTAANLKSYSGKRVKNDSIRMVYFHDQTVAIVELEPDKMLLSCELIEVYGPEDVIKSLGELEAISRPVGITFNEMTKLMSQCQQLEENKADEKTKNATNHMIAARGILANNPIVLLSGIIPGTKWCGTGDIAHDYHDLGTDLTVDKCCRAHDLCPVKVRSHAQRYNLTNNSLYTKSHCTCDDDLYTCLQTNESPTAHIMGNIYFNLVQVPCLAEDENNVWKFRMAQSNF